MIKEKRHYTPKKRFIAGPISYEWVSAACAINGKAAHIAWAIWYRVGLTSSQTVTIPSHDLKAFNLTRQALSNGLASMEEAGLLVVKRIPGKSLHITIKPASLQIEPKEKS
jgi:DNA-binding MarR family transcriptional regulator